MKNNGYVVYTRTPEGRIVLKSEYPKGRLNILAVSDDDSEELERDPIKNEEEFWERMRENSRAIKELSESY